MLILISPRHNKSKPKNNWLGFTATDLIVTAGILSMIVSLTVISLVNIRNHSQERLCSENLHQINQSILAHANDHSHRLLTRVSGAPGDLWWWYKEQIKPYLSPAPGSTNLFACPNDRGYSDPKPFHETARFDYGSYVFNGVTMPGVPNIAGWELGSIVEPRRTLLAMEWTAHAPLSWHRSRTGRRNAPFYCDAQSIVGFVDGHVGMTKIYYDGYTAAFLRDPIGGYAYRFSGN
jgi:hypothetical protein